MKLVEVKREEDLYYSGCFWVVANTFEDIIKGNFKLLVDKYLVDYEGKEVLPTERKLKVHKNIWDTKYKKIYNEEYNYYPRGRVSFYNGKCYINLVTNVNFPKVMHKIYEEFDLNRLNNDEIEIIEESKEHYNFLLK